MRLLSFEEQKEQAANASQSAFFGSQVRSRQKTRPFNANATAILVQKKEKEELEMVAALDITSNPIMSSNIFLNNLDLNWQLLKYGPVDQAATYVQAAGPGRKECCFFAYGSRPREVR